jgi:hypothetical protein
MARPSAIARRRMKLRFLSSLRMKVIDYQEIITQPGKLVS